MERSWGDLGLWLTGVAVMVIGAACPIYLFSSEGYESLFGNIVYALAGILLFLSGLGIVFFRAWLRTGGHRPDANAASSAVSRETT